MRGFTAASCWGAPLRAPPTGTMVLEVDVLRGSTGADGSVIGFGYTVAVRFPAEGFWYLASELGARTAPRAVF